MTNSRYIGLVELYFLAKGSGVFIHVEPVGYLPERTNDAE